MVCLMFFVVFMLKVSPQNGIYVRDTINSTFHVKISTPNPVVNAPVIAKPDSFSNPEEQKKYQIATGYLDSIAALGKPKSKPKLLLTKKIMVSDRGRIYIQPPDTNTEQNYLSKTMEPERKRMLDFINDHKANMPLSTHNNSAHPLPGKLTGAIQTVSFLYHHPAKILTGMGIGNFSSKIAFRALGLGIRGQYPKNYTYLNPAFLSNHLDLYMSFFSKEVVYRSVKNNPFSVYDQLLAEYGLLGFLAFMIYYLGFFAKHYKILTYGLSVLAFVMLIFFVDYWFEQLSVLILFELLFFLNIKEHKNLTANAN